MIVRAAAVLVAMAAWCAAQPADTAAKIRHANELMQSGKAEESIPLYRELAEAFPGVPSFGINLAVAEYKAGRYRDAIRQCQELLKLRPDIFQAWLFLGASRLELGETEAAIEPFSRAVALQPEDRNARLMFGDALLHERRTGEAATQFEEATRLAPESPRAWDGLLRAYEGLADGAFAALQSAAPASAETRAIVGFIELDHGQLARAFGRFREALAQEPAFPGLHSAIAGIYETTGHADWAGTERAKEKPVDCGSPSPACDFAAGQLEQLANAPAATPNALYWHTRALQELAGRAYSRLAALPDSVEKFDAAARRYERSAMYREAAGALEQARKLAPANLDIGHRLALALCRSNDCGSALSLIKDLLGREPQSAQLNYLYGEALASLQSTAQALPYLEAAVKLDGGLLAARGALGEAYLESGSAERAIPQLEAAIATDDDGIRHYQLARAYQAAGRREQAAAVLLRYREILDRRAKQESAEPRITPP